MGVLVEQDGVGQVSQHSQVEHDGVKKPSKLSVLEHDGAKKPSKLSVLEHDGMKKPSKLSMVDTAKKPGLDIGFHHFDENKDGEMSRYEYAYALVKMTQAELKQEEDKKVELSTHEMRTKRCEAENKRDKTEKKSKKAEAEHKIWKKKLDNATKKKKKADTTLDAAKENVKVTMKKDDPSLAQTEENPADKHEGGLAENKEEGPSDKKEEAPSGKKFVAQCSREETEGATILKVEEATAAVQIAGARVDSLQHKVNEVLSMWAKEKIRHHEEVLGQADKEHKEAAKDLAAKRVEADEAEKDLAKRNEALEKLG